MAELLEGGAEVLVVDEVEEEEELEATDGVTVMTWIIVVPAWVRVTVMTLGVAGGVTMTTLAG